MKNTVKLLGLSLMLMGGGAQSTELNIDFGEGDQQSTSRHFTKVETFLEKAIRCFNKRINDKLVIEYLKKALGGQDEIQALIALSILDKNLDHQKEYLISLKDFLNIEELGAESKKKLAWGIAWYSKYISNLQAARNSLPREGRKILVGERLSPNYQERLCDKGKKGLKIQTPMGKYSDDDKKGNFFNLIQDKVLMAPRSTIGVESVKRHVSPKSNTPSPPDMLFVETRVSIPLLEDSGKSFFKADE